MISDVPWGDYSSCYPQKNDANDESKKSGWSERSNREQRMQLGTLEIESVGDTRHIGIRRQKVVMFLRVKLSEFFGD